MPKDEDILQLVSPALLSEVEDPGCWGQDAALLLGPPSCIGPSGRWRSECGGSTSPALPNWGCQARPRAGAAGCFNRGCAGEGGGAGLGQQDSCQGVRKERGPVGPARLARSCGSRETPVPHTTPCLASSERVSYRCVHTHRHTHSIPHFRVLPFTLHTMDHPIHKQRTLDTQPHTAHPSTSTPYTAVCDDTHHLPDTPYQALTTIHTTPRCYTQAPTTPHPRPQTSQRTTHSSASQIPTTQHRSVSHHIHLDFSSPQHEHLGHHRCLLLSQHVSPQTSRSLLHPSTGTCAHRCHSNPDFHNHDASANALSVTASTRRSPTAHRAGTTDAARGGPCPHTCIPVYATRSVRVTHAHSHTHAVSLCFAPSSDPKSRAALCPVPGFLVSWVPARCQLACPPRSLPPPPPTRRRPRAKPGRSWGLQCWLLPWMCSHNHCNHSAMLGPMPLWEPPACDLDCPLALPGEGEAGAGGSPQVSRALPLRPQAVCWGDGV